MRSTESSLLLSVAAGAAVSLGASSASAATVITDPTDITIGQGGSATGAIYFDPQTGYAGSTQAEGSTGINADFELSYFYNANTAGNSPAKPLLSTSNSGGTQSGQTFADANNHAPRFGISTGINANSATLESAGNGYYLHNTDTTTTYNWNAGQGGGFLGLAFTANAATGTVASGTLLYGWAEVSYNADQSLTLYRLGYDNAGGTSTTPAALAPGNSAVPEPGSLAAVATLGAAGILAYRRRRAQGQQAVQA